VIGGLVLAGVTSLPNAVSALYLAVRGRGAATLSIALNSNALNVTVGLLLPGIFVGLGRPSGQGTVVAAWYLGLTAVTLACAYSGRGLRRAQGTLISCGYVAFIAAVLISS
jgi:Ca2+/Na+ antiporter